MQLNSLTSEYHTAACSGADHNWKFKPMLLLSVGYVLFPLIISEKTTKKILYLRRRAAIWSQIWFVQAGGAASTCLFLTASGPEAEQKKLHGSILHPQPQKRNIWKQTQASSICRSCCFTPDHPRVRRVWGVTASVLQHYGPPSNGI